MSDAFDFLRKRRQQMAENPGASAKALNNDYCRKNGLPHSTARTSTVIQDGSFSDYEIKKQQMDDDFHKTLLRNKISSCGESQIGRNASAGKHGMIMEVDESDLEPMPEFKSIADQARYMHQKNREKRVADDTHNRLVNTVLGSHILHQIVDEKSIGSQAIIEARNSADLKDVTDIKADLKKGHQQMYRDNDYNYIKSIRKKRVFDQTDEQGLSAQHESALGSYLETQASTLESQEVVRGD